MGNPPTAIAELRKLPVSHETLEKVLALRAAVAARKKADEAQPGIDEEKIVLENDLLEFVRAAWPSFDAGEYQECWAIDALCDHLQAVTSGQIRRLLINFPPRCGKTTVTSVAYPAWIWARQEVSYLSGPQVRFLCGSYSDRLALENSSLTRRLITSPWYQRRWGARFQFRPDQNTKSKFDTSAGGSRISVSVGGSLLGIGGDVLIVDDPHNTEIESDLERERALRWWRELSSTRLNDPKRTPIIVIMQRLHEEDVSGQILSSTSAEWVHLCYDEDTEILTENGWIFLSDLKPDVAVLGVNPTTLEAQWELPTQYIRQIYNGDVYHFKSLTADLMVTPDHRMVYGDVNDAVGGDCKLWRARPANELPSSFYLPQVVKWKGISNHENIEFGKRKWSPRVFAEFMGWYLAEGCASAKSRKTRIVQKANGKHVDDLKRVLSAIPFHVSSGRHNNRGMMYFQIGNRYLARELEQLGKSLEKRAPQVLKELSPECLQAFLLAYAKGDGYGQKHNPKKIYIGTGSKQMADDLQECAIKAGWSATLSVYKQKGGESFNGYIRHPCTVYRIYLRASKAVGKERKMSSKIGKNNIKIKPYGGYVFCVSVPSSAVVVRRNGRVAISGNCIPMEYDWPRHCVTSLGWQDPRGFDDNGDMLVSVERDTVGNVYRVPSSPAAELKLEKRGPVLMWPERFGPEEVALMKAELGPYMASGRLQQVPTPDKGGIFQRDWWQLWEGQDGKFPLLDYVVASLDSAFTADQQNDPSALTVWGVFKHPQLKQRRIILLHAWRKHLRFSGPRMEREDNETVIPGMAKAIVEAREARYRRRCQPHWGLMEWTADTCRRFKVDRLLIEAKASGISAAQELGNRYGREEWGVQLCPVKGDKVARAIAVQATFAGEMIYAPDRDWAEMVIKEMVNFPLGKYDDLTDSATQAIKHLRDNGLAMTDAEVVHADRDALPRHRNQLRPVYPV